MGEVEDLQDLSRSITTPGRRLPTSLLKDVVLSASVNDDRAVDEDATCRVCLEGESEHYLLIHPCRCSGSVKHIHEECLKTWITGHNDDIDKSNCELCKTPYVMEFIMATECMPSQVCKEGLSSCLFTPLLFAVLGILILVCYLMLSTYLPEANGTMERSYTISLLLICFISAVVILAMLVNFFKNACLKHKIAFWHILSQDINDEARHSLPIHPQDDSIGPSDQQHLIEDEVLVVPRSVRVGGRRVTTPALRPCLTPLRSGSSSMAFATPKTQSVSATPWRSRMPSIEPVRSLGTAKVRPATGVNETQIN